MRGKQGGKELERLDTGLALAGDEDFIPKPIEEELESKTAKDLLDLAQLGDRLEDAVKIRNGWIYIMLRRKVGHGGFKKFLEEHRIRYMKAWECMCYARAAARHPALVGKITGNAVRKILMLPEPEIHKIEERITGIPAEEAAKLTRRWIEKEYRQIQDEKATHTRRKPKPPPNPDEVELPTELAGLVAKALSKLNLISELKISAKIDLKNASRYAQEIETAWNRAAYNLHDPEHKKTPWWETHISAETEFPDEGAGA